ncbi:glycosyltransferase family 25 protein [Pseudomonas auratipiscis]|uniref:Glycosyltransferase family 25 protein n=1 Tax=Pseudomonas auratipiscis TaxID=3115853 RepID=A0AB35WYW2_9PSED|nr:MULTISPECIES: glycosyltransferase family 25 protein [unclassified Pseudomonas]MEE1868604.1 glycosyltransferase family 25 protein [Pseudomonas sp. 120P]MEE1959265.1 glycosyltransferase family 25 protein [Pseudomonas sp. 119P]
MNVIDYFDQTRIINIPSRKDRRVETVEEFSRNGFHIDHKKAGFFEAVKPSEEDGFPSIGARGCFMSHLRIIEDAIRLNLNNILILEDDIQFSKHIGQYGKQAIALLEGMEWDIAYFGHPFEGNANLPGWSVVDRPIHLSHFYAVNGAFLPQLRDFLLQILERPAGHPDGGPMHYDAALNTLIHQRKDVRAYYFTWNLGYQRPSRTDLHELSVLDRTQLLRPIMFMLRKLKSSMLRITR